MNIKNDLKFNEDLNNLVNKRKYLFENLDLLIKNFEEFDSDFKNFVDKYMINQKKGDVELDSTVNSLFVNYNYKLLFNLLKDKKDGIESLYKHIGGVEIYKEFDETVKVLEENKNLLINLRSGGVCESVNNLFLSDSVSSYLISDQLESYLVGEFLFKNNKSFFVVVFNTITKGDSKVLIYNYMEYNINFIELFYAYLLLEFKLSRSSLHKGNDNFCLVDKDLYNGYGLDKYKVCKDFNSDRFKLNIINFFQDVIENYQGILHKDLDKMGEIVFNLVNKDYESLVKNLNGGVLDVSKLESIDEYHNIEFNNLLPKFIFVVSDLNSFIEKIKLNFMKDVNQGPQKYRGRVNSLSHSLFLLNKYFIDSLWLHHREFCSKYSVFYKERKTLPQSVFNFNNINMKLGNIRWYSVGRNINKDIILRRRGKLYPVGAPQLICREFGVKEINPILFCKQCVVRYSIKSINQRRNTVWHSHQEIKSIIYNNPINEETQIKIEKYNLDKYTLKYGEGDIYSHNIGYKLSDEGRNFYIDCRKSLCTLINNFKARELDKNQNKNIQAKHIFECKKILDKLEVDFVVNLQLWFVLKILNLFKEEEKSATKIYLEIGKAFINKYYYVLYKEKNDMVDNINYKMNDWRAENIDLINKYDDTALHGLGSIILNWIVEIELLQIEVISNPISGYKKLSIITATKKLNSFRINNFVILPNKLPMIVKPNEFEMDTTNGKFKKLGGFLLNNEDYVNDLIIHNWRSKEKTKINKINSIISVVNNISSVGYKINKDVLSFIRLNDKRLDLTLVNKEHPLEDKIKGGDKLTRLEKTQLESYNSKKSVEENIIGLADIFENINEFFIPVRIDFRGRMYCDVDYLNYQGTELAKSLLLFSKGEKIFKTDVSSINYIKIHGANSYGNEIDKKSFEDRVRWVDENTEKIRNFDDTLINHAASKLMFIAFCYEYNKMLDCIDISDNEYFVTHLPIQLDASCNGYQHISMLVRDIDMAKNLNLVKSNKSDAPQDFYGHISNYLNICFMGEGEEILKKDKSLKESLTRLKKLKINRGLIKKAIMTIPYNATSLKLIEYLKEPFEYDKEYTEYRLKESMGVNFDKKEIWYRLKTNKDIKLQEKDFLAWYYMQKFILEKLFPSLTNISTYFKEVATICTKLGLAIPWKLPTGLVAYQSYLKVKEIRVKPLNFSKNTFNLKVLVRDEYDKIKQIRGLMPNLIHSLDSTSMTLLMDKYFNSIDNEYKNIYAIHDCFAVTANNMENLIHLLKMIYISLYSDDGYLVKFDAYVRIHIKNHYGDVFSEDGLEINVSKLDPIKYPDLKKVLKNTYNIKMLLDSSYLIQ